MIWILWVIVGLAAVILIAGIICFRIVVVRPKQNSVFDPVPEYYVKHADQYNEGLSFYKTRLSESYTLTSRDGLKLKAFYYKHPSAKRVILLAHGYHGSPIQDYAGLIPFLYEHECSLFLIHERCHGDSEGRYITFGMRESEDIADWMNLLAAFPENKNLDLYFYGISMGAASVMMASAENLPDHVRGLIADCGYADAWEQVCYSVRHFAHIPKIPIMYIIDACCRIFARYSLKDKSPEKAMQKDTRIPVLFIQGTADEMVLAHHTLRNYDSCVAQKTILMVDDAPHAQSCYQDPEKVRKAISDFIGRTQSTPA